MAALIAATAPRIPTDAMPTQARHDATRGVNGGSGEATANTIVVTI